MNQLTESRLKLHDWIIGYDYFISYSHKDGLNYPKQLKIELEKNGFQVCLDQEDFLAGQELAALTKRRIRASRNLVVVGRRYALSKSKWVPEEVALFVKKSDSKSTSGPIIIDVNDAVSKCCIANAGAGMRPTLARRLSEKDWLRIPESLADPDGTPSSTVLDEISKAYSGIRAQTRQLRIQSLAILALALFATGLVFAFWQSYQNSQIAQAEALAATALTEVTTEDPLIGFAGSAIASAAAAISKRSTAGTRTSASRVIQKTPAGLLYSAC